jgi:hypothetical protein
MKIVMPSRCKDYELPNDKNSGSEDSVLSRFNMGQGLLITRSETYMLPRIEVARNQCCLQWKSFSIFSIHKFAYYIGEMEMKKLVLTAISVWLLTTREKHKWRFVVFRLLVMLRKNSDKHMTVSCYLDY